MVFKYPSELLVNIIVKFIMLYMICPCSILVKFGNACSTYLCYKVTHYFLKCQYVKSQTHFVLFWQEDYLNCMQFEKKCHHLFRKWYCHLQRRACFLVTEKIRWLWESLCKFATTFKRRLLFKARNYSRPCKLKGKIKQAQHTSRAHMAHHF